MVGVSSGGKILYRVESLVKDALQYREWASTPKGLGLLGWNPGEVDSIVAVISKKGAIYTLNPDINREGFSAISGGDKPKTLKEIADQISGAMEWESSRHDLWGNPRAIIEPGYEDSLRKIARRLKLSVKPLEGVV